MLLKLTLPISDSLSGIYMYRWFGVRVVPIALCVNLKYKSILLFIKINNCRYLLYPNLSLLILIYIQIYMWMYMCENMFFPYVRWTCLYFMEKLQHMLTTSKHYLYNPCVLVLICGMVTKIHLKLKIFKCPTLTVTFKELFRQYVAKRNIDFT